MSVATASRLPPPRRVPPAAVADAGEGTTLELVTVGAANVGIALLIAVSVALLAVGHRERMETAFFVAGLALAPAGVAIAKRQCGRVGPRRYASLAILDVAGLSVVILARARRRGDPRDRTPSRGSCSPARPWSPRSTSSSTDGPISFRRSMALRARSRSSERAHSSARPCSVSTPGRCSAPSGCGCVRSSRCSSPPFAGSAFRCRARASGDA